MSKNTITGLQDGVNASEQTQETNTKALLKGFQKVVIAGILASSVNMSNAEPASSTSFVANPAYEIIIAEAKKVGKDPVEVAKMKKDAGEWNIKQYVEFSKYNRSIQEQAIAEWQEQNKEILAKIADLRKETAELKAQTLNNKAETAKMATQDIENYKRLIAIIEWLEKSGKFTPKDVQVINDIYNDTVTPASLKAEIDEKFGKYIDKGRLTIAQRS